jgi:hypothetical protein
MQKGLGDMLVADTRPVIEPKLKALEQTLMKQMGISPAAAAASAPATRTPAPKK